MASIVANAVGIDTGRAAGELETSFMMASG
jgi:hypothetical protein